MKNIHILPTDKPSRLSILNSGKLNFGAEIMSSFNSKPQHIYITSDEEIKDDDWFIQVNTSKRINHHSKNGFLLQPQSFDKKIILTTDQDLIKDGVQSIDDTFLEWFVKNPSCEYVEVEKWSSLAECGYSYHITIPKEDPKLKHEKIIDLCGGEERFKEICKLKPKQEPTLEEAAERLVSDCTLEDKQIFEQGAKWQEERMYSEEDMRKCWNAAYIDALAIDEETYKPLFFEDFIEQFKKKQ
jgi:hypothetical protein